jgi:ABC-type protease/lipase transport system fused ATPase/permease subunit
MASVREAAESVGLHDKISGLIDGYETSISEQAYLFSGGEKQRLGLARAVYKSPQLIVLDEPNSNLDKKGEDYLMQTLERLKGRGCTVVVVTHRKQLLRLANKLLVMQDGKLKIFGPKDKVYEKMGMSHDV